jgi:peptide/nickel transport system ATP-binding protein
MIRIDDLSLWHGRRTILRNFSVEIPSGCTLALIGESGGGKTSLARLIMGLLDGMFGNGSSQPGFQWRGAIWVGDTNVLTASPRRLRAMRGRDMAMVVQGLSDALNPQYTVFDHLEESRRHHGLSPASVDAMCRRHNIPAHVLHRYPAQLSGGEIQRVLIALALAGSPRCLILDEPTASLDQEARMLAFEALSEGSETRAQLLITHDLNLVRRMAHQVAVLRGGQIVDSGDVRETLERPKHGYTRSLLTAMTPLPTSQAGVEHLASSGRLQVSGVRCAYGTRRILRQIDFELPGGKCLAIMGESGSGKSTLARILAGYQSPDSGTVGWMDPNGMVQPRRAALIPQHPHRALARHFCVSDVLDEAFRFGGSTLSAGQEFSRSELLQCVGLPSDSSFMARNTGVLSGGEAQRLVIARALACKAECLIADEPTAALDAVAREKLIRLLRQLCSSRGVALVVFTHDNDVADGLADQLACMDNGRLRINRPQDESVVLNHAT